MTDVRNYCPKCKKEVEMEEMYIKDNVLHCSSCRTMLIFNKKEEVEMKKEDKTEKAEKVINYVKNTLGISNEKHARSIIAKAYNTLTAKIKNPS